MQLKAIAAFTTISLIWGILPILQSPEVEPAKQLQTSAIACLLAALVLTPTAFLTRNQLPNRKQLGLNATLGITLIAAPHLLSLWASASVSPGLAFILFAATPIVTAFLCDAPWAARNAGVAGIAGITLLAADTASTSLTQWTGAAALTLGIVAIAASLVFAKARVQQIHPLIGTAIQLATAGAALWIAGILLPGSQGVSARLALSWPLIFITAAASGVAYPLYYWLLRALRPDQLASTVWAQFAVSVIASIAIYRIHPQWRMLVGLAVIAASLVILTRSKQENKLFTLGVTPLSR